MTDPHVYLDGHAVRTVDVRVVGVAKLPDAAVWTHPRVIRYDCAPVQSARLNGFPNSTWPPHEVQYTLDYSDGWTWQDAEADARMVLEAHALEVLAVRSKGWE